MNDESRKKPLTIPMIIIGNLIYAFSLVLFILPADLMSCGTTGIALTIRHFFGISIPVFVFVFNVIMLALGWMILGRTFAMTTILSSLIGPVFLQMATAIVGNRIITDNMLLNVLFGGMGLGVALGIVIRAGASTGGMDIPPLILKHYFRIPVSISLWFFDFCILLSQLIFHKAEDLLYGVLLILTLSVTMNRVLLAGTSRTEVKIVSNYSREIRDAILSQVDRGVTLLHGEGGFLREPREVILSVVFNHELPRVEHVARTIDPDCFMIISQVTEVWGRGFTRQKKDGRSDRIKEQKKTEQPD